MTQIRLKVSQIPFNFHVQANFDKDNIKMACSWRRMSLAFQFNDLFSRNLKVYINQIKIRPQKWHILKKLQARSQTENLD